MTEITLRDIFDGAKEYVVPTYQRGYAWTKDQIDDFLNDLVEARNTNDYKHFFGFLLTVDEQGDSKHTIKIIDGQQRMTTVILFLIAARNFYNKLKTTMAESCSAMTNKLIFI